MKIHESKLIEKITISALVVFFIADASNKLLIFNEFGFYRASVFIRALYQIIFLAVIVVFINKSRANFLIGGSLFFFLFLMGQISFVFLSKNENHILENVLIFNKYMYIILIYMFLYKIKFDKNVYLKIRNIYEWVLIANPMLAIAGFMFKIKLFETYYREGSRFGYGGLIPAQNEASIIFLIALLYFYHNYFYLKRRRNFLIISILASLLLGTKAIYFSLAILLLFHYFNFLSVKKIFYSSVLVILTSFLTIKFFYSEKSQEVLAYFKYFLKKEGWLYMLLSGRNTFIETKLISTVSNWNMYNFLFGGQDQTMFLIEMDFFDLFLFFGILGAVFYMYLYYKTIFNFGQYSNFNLFVVLIFVFMAFLSGHFFTSAVISLYLCFFTLSLSKELADSD